MIGGKLIEIMPVVLPETRRNVLRLWVTSTDPDYPGECAVFAEPQASLPALGDTVWWTSGRILFDGDRQELRKVGYSFDPTRTA